MCRGYLGFFLMQTQTPPALAINTDFSHFGFWIQGSSLDLKQAPARIQLLQAERALTPRHKSPLHGQNRSSPERRLRPHFCKPLLDLCYRGTKKKPSILQHLLNQDYQTIQEIISHSTTVHKLDCDPELFWQNPFTVLHSRNGGKPGSFTSRNCKIWAMGFLSLWFAAVI